MCSLAEAQQHYPAVTKAQTQNLSDHLLNWYDRHHRDLPWRVSPSDSAKGKRSDPYRIWLSEIMLQQTQVETVKPYFAKFVALWPEVRTLAAADQEAVMKAWAGLGYYSRARNLKKCAEIVANEYDEQFPDTPGELQQLPGIGDYTASAIAAIAFGQPVPVVDGNVERVVSRLTANSTPLPKSKTEIKRYVSENLSKNRPGDFAQAMMDLGATVCTPRKPACIVCPIHDHCAALGSSDPELFPFKAPKKKKPVRHGAVFVAVRSDCAILLRKRPDRGLLAGMTEAPTTGWSAGSDGETEVSAAPFDADWKKSGTVRHIFTHFELNLVVYRAQISDANVGPEGWWSSPVELPSEALPTVMKKAIEIAVPNATKPAKNSQGIHGE